MPAWPYCDRRQHLRVERGGKGDGGYAEGRVEVVVVDDEILRAHSFRPLTTLAEVFRHILKLIETYLGFAWA